MDSVVWCRSLALLSLNHDFFAVDDVDAGRQGVHIGCIFCHLDAVDVVNGLVGCIGK